MSSSGSANAAEIQYSYTKIRTERIIHNWSIMTFHLLPQRVDEILRSPWFYSRDKREKWCLDLYTRGEFNSSFNGIDYVALRLTRDSPGKSPMTICTELKICRSNQILKYLSFTHEYKPQSNWGSSRFLERSKLLVTNPSEDDQFTISCIIYIPAKVITSSYGTAIFDSEESQLSDDFRSLFESPVFSDFTIIVGDIQFATHKVILASRSPVFAAMFEHKDMEENRKKEMKIENMEPDVIKGMLEFIYTDQVTNMKELASGLLEAADKYDLENLRTRCEKTLYEGLDKDNAAEILLLADLHHANTLREYVMEYIVHHAPELIKSNNWKKIGVNPELLLELFDCVVLHTGR